MTRRTSFAQSTIAAFVVFLALTVPATAFAAGQTQEEDFQQVEGTGNWEHTIDVSDREPGLYNILVRARDEAGNEALGGPYNVFVDPASDLPRLSISYPITGQAVGERLFVVGTARDDDAVGHVEVQINDAPFTRAEGGEYWSALLPMNNLPDGPHTLRARAIDVNGVEGELVEVVFRLDTTSPVSVPTSHESGVLVSRRTTIQGTVDDANGVASLTLVAGDERRRLPLQGGTDSPRRFSFEINPDQLDEGATVWWLESVDETGAVGVTPFLFFVDTSPPELELLYPTADDRVDAQLRFAGRVSDLVGLSSLEYRLSTGQNGTIELTPGDPFWALEVNLEPESRGNVEATFLVTDVAGNETTERIRLELDRQGDLPVVSIASPAAGSAVDHAVLSGHVVDDDGAASVIYAIDGGEETTIELPVGRREGFAVPLPGLAPGNHTIAVRAVDRFGVAGEERTVRFVQAAPLPAIELASVIRGETVEPYAPGFALAAGERASIQVSLASSSGAPLPARISYAIGTSTGTAQVSDDATATINLPRSSVPAALPVELFTSNEAGRVSRTTGFFIQMPAQEEGAAAPAITDVLSRGLYLRAGEVDLSENETPVTDAPITLARGESLRLLAVGGRPASASITPEADFLRVSTSGTFVVVEATGDGAVSGLRVSAEIGGSTVRSEPFSLVTEQRPPRLSLPEPLIGRLASESAPFTLTVRDDSAIASVEALVRPAPVTRTEGDAEGEPVAASGTRATVEEVEGSAGEYRITPQSTVPEGPALIEVTATDASGASGSVTIPIAVDRSAPELRFLTPPRGTTVNGTITVIGLLSEPGSTERITVGTDEPVELEVARLVRYSVATTAETDAITFTLLDRAGNAGESSVGLQTDEASDRPVLQVQVPVEGGVVTDEFRLSGVVLDDDAAEAVTYRVNDRDPVTVGTDGTFDITVPMEDLEDGEHTVTVTGVDIGGAVSEPVTRSFAISRTQPVSTVTAPSIESYQREHVTINGTAEDPNGIALVEVSTDNGASYQRAEGAESWAYVLDTTLIDDGTHSILVRTTDGAGETSLLSTTINIDNTAPILELTEPGDGVTVSGRFMIDGRGEDAALERVRVVAQPLDNGESAPIELVSFERPGPFAYVVDTSTLPNGWYNLRVEAEDRAGNSRRISRNLLVEPANVSSAPEILVPADGASLAHRFRVTVASPPAAGPVTLLADGSPVGVIQIAESGIGTLEIEPDMLRPGAVALSLRTEAQEDGEPLVSAVHTVDFAEYGAWVTVDAPLFLSYVRDRPFVTGAAGYALDLPEGEDNESERARRDLLAAHRIERIEVSLDNGRSYQPARGTEEWQYRLETTELTDGRHNLLVRASYADGSSRVTRHSLVVDEQAPEVRLLEPQERGVFDESIRIVGVTTDENALRDVAVVLREGDKASYSVPSFIQGLYVDVHGLGATYFDVGAGLTFFDNNVRLQGQIGVSPPGRFSGLVLGAKLLANVAALPASYFFGPDYEWLSGALAIGANFSYFTMSEDSIAFTEEGLVLAGMVAQLEFPIVTVPDLVMFNTYSFYTEAQLWFISSDIDAGTEFRLAFGLRADVF